MTQCSNFFIKCLRLITLVGTRVITFAEKNNIAFSEIINTD